MSRNERLQNKRDRQKMLAIKKPNELVTRRDRIIVITISIAFIFLFLYLALRDNSLPDNELSTINVTLKDTPKYDEYKIKSTTYRDIILTTKEYQHEFKITAMTYKATDHNSFKANIKVGDRVGLKIKKSELDNLNKGSFWNDYNDVYGLKKDGINYINLELKTELEDKDSKWSYFFVVVGIVMLPYGFIKNKPLISMDRAVTLTMILGLILLLIFD
ncbi:hypothetical protein [Lacihabitans sp. CCS-44]|uniref:hypothetical protein n=1 Tax=Lacihabitans sp. CCS-44 TaxID=2487331 RepID=UPI0020CF3DE3|nr:hypothetical protein [Lacihabitans sp. CCS-44]